MSQIDLKTYNIQRINCSDVALLKRIYYQALIKFKNIYFQ
jgi:hypothetical protein